LERTDFRLVLQVLSRHRVDFVIVGGMAAVLQGAPVSTFDLDIVHSRDAANLDRLVGALRELDAFYRDKPDLRITPDPSKLRGPGHHLLLTSAGPLDVLGAVVTGDTYPELAMRTRSLDLGDGIRALVLDLEAVIEIKERLDSERDRAVLPILRRTLAEQRPPKKS
jgi:hypothetical protein